MITQQPVNTNQNVSQSRNIEYADIKNFNDFTVYSDVQDGLTKNILIHYTVSDKQNKPYDIYLSGENYFGKVIAKFFNEHPKESANFINSKDYFYQKVSKDQLR